MRQLSAVFVRNVRHSGKPGPDKYNDQHGLILRVQPSGAKAWIWRGTVRGRRKDYGLGRYPYVTLAAARDKAFQWRSLAAAGEDPRKQGRESPTFAEAATKLIDKYSRVGKWKTGGGSERQWRNSLQTYAIPHLGKLRVDEITTRDVTDCLLARRFWTRKPTTAQRVRQRIRAVMQWAVAEQYRADNPAGDTIDEALGWHDTRKTRFRSLPHNQVAAALRRIWVAKAWTGSKLALEYVILTAARQGAVRGATWDQVDLNDRVWLVPPTKTEEGLRVPLAPRAVEVLEEAGQLSGREGRIFLGVRGGPMCPNSMGRVLRAAGVDCVPHGFRASFADWFSERTEAAREVGRAGLGHTVQGVEAAYFRSDMLEKRRPIMEAWAEYVGGR